MSKSALILSSTLGTETFYGSIRDIPADRKYTKGKVDGTLSYYVVYKKEGFHDDHSHSSTTYEIVENTNDASFSWNARSAQGFDKTGVAIFEHHHFSGTGVNYTASTPDISDSFPTETDMGASSFIVSKGVWSFYSEPNYQGTKIRLGGLAEFGPGYRLEFVGSVGDDRIRSIKYIREN